MEASKVKQKMMNLWKKIFHDSDKYVALVFDNYFDPELIEFHEEKGEIVSALLGVPYEFGKVDSRIKGLYLCGLATEVEFRHHGIMNSLIEKINSRAAEKGYAFTFLIPANDALINFYSCRKYDNAMYRIEDRYTSAHNFRNDYSSVLDNEDERVKILKMHYYENLEVGLLDVNDVLSVEKVERYIESSENNVTAYNTLFHDAKDMHAVIAENSVSGGRIFVCSNPEKEITGVAFIDTDERKRVYVRKVYYDDNCTYFRLLDYVRKSYADSPISVFRFPEEVERRAICMKVYGASNPDGGMLEGQYGATERVYNVSVHAKPYGMIRITDLREILKFLANDRRDAKFSILVKEEKEDDFALKCDVADGKAVFTELEGKELKRIMSKPGSTTLTRREFSEIIFRKKDASNIIMEAFGIPRLIMNMALLLD